MRLSSLTIVLIVTGCDPDVLRTVPVGSTTVEIIMRPCVQMLTVESTPVLVYYVDGSIASKTETRVTSEGPCS